MTLNPEYFGLLVYTVLAVGMGVGALVGIRIVMWLLGTAKKKKGKDETYECGVPLLSTSRQRFSVKFFLVALLFVLFDIETVFLLPYAVSYRELGKEGFFGVLAFIAVLGVGLLYVLWRRALEWD